MYEDFTLPMFSWWIVSNFYLANNKYIIGVFCLLVTGVIAYSRMKIFDKEFKQVIEKL